tara:strand:- start:725 stop:1750 length:1026 start_codon:yes stop_codon:yes gene_type:complete
MSINLKYFPEMNAYYDMPPLESPPFAMLSNPRSYVSQNINTDKYGFRKTLCGSEVVSVENIHQYEKINILVGGSVVFGMGSSNDSTTISSNLAKLTGEIWLNMGVKSAVSFQEYIHLINHINKAKKINNIIFFSGMNDVYKSFTDFKDTHFDKWFTSNNSEYLQQNLAIFSARRLAFAFLKSIIFSRSIREFLPGKFEASSYADENIDLAISNLSALYDRNFKLYKGLSSFTNAKVSYFLQPFSFWTNKELTIDEKKSREYLESLQSDSEWPSSRERLNNKTIKDKVTNILSENASKNQFLFCDTNNFFNKNVPMFIDAVHLNDNGAKLASELIFNKLGFK